MDVLLQRQHAREQGVRLALASLVVVNAAQDDRGTQVIAAALDVLAPGIGEIIGGSQREERLEVLERRMEEHDLDKETYNWYLDLRRYGTVPHAGFGLGLERLVNYITGLSNIRDAIPYPRVPGRADF